MVISCFNHAPPLSFTILQGTIPNFSKTHQIPKLKLNPSLTFLPHRLRHDSFTSPHRRRQSPSRPAVTRKPPLAPSAQATDRRSQTLSVAVGRTLLSVSRQPPSVAYTAVRSRCYPSNHYIAASRSAAPIPIKGGGSGSGRIGLRIGVNAEEEEGDHEVVGDGTRHPYSQKETLALYDAWISVSYDSVVGNQQTNKCFWKKVTEVYNARRPKNTFARNLKMLRSHWERCDKDVKKFCAIYRAEAANYQSRSSGADIRERRCGSSKTTSVKISSLSMFGRKSITLKGGLAVSSRARNARSTRRVVTTHLVMAGKATPRVRARQSMMQGGLLPVHGVGRKGPRRRRRRERGGEGGPRRIKPGGRGLGLRHGHGLEHPNVHVPGRHDG
ncbi:uncharacterized protein LOC125195043 [Salvia hispanica]|uniref:uncharacterized protein LOC125195043 n=1 Tax=Salvia hispanica TaxID=49212 RepID=UPI002009463B|nr:uncharacterized protein LOC125195043 [Salvia hispanica]